MVAGGDRNVRGPNRDNFTKAEMRNKGNDRRADSPAMFNG